MLLASFLAARPATSSAQSQTTATPNTAWQQAAGTSLSFEVASVRPDPGPFHPPSFALSADDWFREPSGRFHADFKLLTYVEFAYKVWLTPHEEAVILDQLPGWVKTDRFAIEATAPLHATKDQYRLMMQALLAERFGLKLHFEQKEQPALAMVLIKPGKPGPRLTPHEQGQPCDEKPVAPTFPFECYGFSARLDKDGRWITGSRATSMDLIANFIGSMAGNSEEVSRRVVDQTGLTGQWDFTLLDPPPGQAQAGSTKLQSVQDQLGIKLKATRATISLPVIDYVQRPTDN